MSKLLWAYRSTEVQKFSGWRAFTKSYRILRVQKAAGKRLQIEFVIVGGVDLQKVNVNYY